MASAAHFEENAKPAECLTEWGWWQQSIDEVVVVVRLPEATSSKNLSVSIGPRSLRVALKCGTTGEFKPLLDGTLHATVTLDDSTWTLEDKKEVRILLVKSARSAEATWPSLLEGQYFANSAVFDSMQKKATLERFSRENPGFDFSGAEITGNYRDGGPTLPTGN